MTATTPKRLGPRGRAKRRQKRGWSATHQQPVGSPVSPSLSWLVATIRTFLAILWDESTARRRGGRGGLCVGRLESGCVPTSNRTRCAVVGGASAWR